MQTTPYTPPPHPARVNRLRIRFTDTCSTNLRLAIYAIKINEYDG
jgi:hypothetical protein